MSQQKSEVAAWYVSRGGDASGPFSTDMLIAMIRKSELQPLDLIFREGETEWRPVATYRELKAGGTASGESTSGPKPSVDDAPKPSGLPSNGPRNDPRTLSWIVLRPHNSTYLQEGPLETQTIIDGLEKGRFQFSQYAWHVGMSQWMRIGDLREFDRRSRTRESKPHVPPPLPDPIAAVMLEDDSDSDAEVFHVSMRGVQKHDLTPNPLESMQAITQLGNAAIGGAAAESPEQKASRAVSLVVSQANLAGVPWEQDPSDGYAQAVELIDDQHSGVHSTFADDDDGDDSFTFTGSIGGAVAGDTSRGPLSGVRPVETAAERLEKTPLPFLPGAPVPLAKDNWDKWGRHVAGAGMLGLVSIFGWHLVTYDAPTKIARAKTAPASVVASVPAPADVPAVVDNFGTDSPDDGKPRAATVAAAPPVPVASPNFPAETAAAFAAQASLAKKTAVAAKPAPPLAPLPASVTPPTSTSSELGIVGLKLDRPDGQIVVQGSYPPGVPIEVTFKGRLGQILSKISVRKTVVVPRKAGEVASLSLKKLRLPAGAYTVEIKVGEATARNDLFIGARDARFLDNLETHLREISLETQTQKKVLFYAAQEMNVLARDLGQNYGELRGKSQLWTVFITRWKQRMDTVNRSLADVAKKSVEDQAYPEETASLIVAQANLKDVAAQYQQAIGQSRDMASDTLTELISELTRQKDAIGQTTARPTADTPDGKL